MLELPRRATTVLVVEDDRAVSRMLRVLLTMEGYDVRVAYHGEEALADVDAVSPALVVLDIQMPVMDGRAFYREFRRRGYDAPVIVLSAWNAASTARELGAQASLEKPCDPADLSQLITRLLSQGYTSRRF